MELHSGRGHGVPPGGSAHRSGGQGVLRVPVPLRGGRLRREGRRPLHPPPQQRRQVRAHMQCVLRRREGDDQQGHRLRAGRGFSGDRGRPRVQDNAVQRRCAGERIRDPSLREGGLPQARDDPGRVPREGRGVQDDSPVLPRVVIQWMW